MNANTNTTFMGALGKTLDEYNNVSVTENCALGYKTTQNLLVDLNFKTTSLRGKTDEEVAKLFADVFMLQDKKLALKWLFFARDIREGLGERRLFRVCLKWLADTEPELAKQLVPFVAEYGRYDDLLPLLDSNISPFVLEYLSNGLKADLSAMGEEKSVTLLAKWLPSVNTSSQQSRRWGRMIAKHLKWTDGLYRRVLSKLRKYIDVVERKMSGGDWKEIAYGKVPSKAHLLYKSAFKKHDAEGYQKYLDALSKGQAKINAATLFPHDIVAKYGYNVYKKPEDETLEALWKNLPNTIKDDARVLVVRDGSGSMQMDIPGQHTAECLHCSTALALYFAERLSGEFHNKFITFSANPKFVDISGLDTLRQKLERVYKEDECTNTNLEKVFMMILAVAKSCKMKQEELPNTILIASDMEFDYACGRPDARLFDVIRSRYETNGYKLPRLVFWNLCSRSETIPVTENELGVALVSGFSHNLAKMVMSGSLSPEAILLETLNVERYSFVDKLTL